MYIGEIISSQYAEVAPSDTIHDVLDRINELHFRQLPVVDIDVFMGLVKEEDLLSAPDDTALVQDIRQTSAYIYVYDYQHTYDALQMMTVYGHDLLPVLDKEHKYLGTVTQSDVLKAINSALVSDEPGAIIILEMDSKDYALSHVSHIIESENAHILSVSARANPEINRTEMTIKVNKTSISAIVASLWRFDYTVKATFHDGSDHSDIQDRYNLLMNYLDI